MIRQIAAPLISLFLYVFGVGLFTTFQAVRLRLLDVSTEVIGLVMSTFSLGVILGGLFSHIWVRRVGHIRAFAAFASATAAVIMLQGVIEIPWVWIVLRIPAGFCAAGLYVVVESWLLYRSTPLNRGLVLSLYMVSFYSAQSVGQFLLLVCNPASFLLFCIPVIFCSLAVWPVSMTRSLMPPIPAAHFVSVRALFRESPGGPVTVFCSGMILGCLYGLLPLFMQGVGISVRVVGVGMGLLIAGGLALQIPVGRLSDRFDRRWIILLSSLFTAGTAVALILLPHLSLSWTLVSFLLLGGFSFTLYPMGISYASDRAEHHQLMGIVASCLLIYSTGAMIGPVVAPLTMNRLGPAGLMIFIAAIALANAVFALSRIVIRAPVPQEERSSFAPIPPRGGVLAGELATTDEPASETPLNPDLLPPT